MKHLIDPTVDCVFKAILGAKGNEYLLIHFLNGLLKLKQPINSVTIENPYNDKKQLDAKLSVVDIMAKDDLGNVYQIELQLTSPKYLTSRMSFNLTQLHSRQLIQGEEYDQVPRTFTIWLCTQDVPFQSSEANENDHDFRFVMYDPKRATLLNEDFEIHVILLNRWQKPQQLSPMDQWIYFFTQAKNWSRLPRELQVEHIRRAMKVLEQFSEQKESYYQYLERFNLRAKELSTEAEYRQIQQNHDQIQQDYQQIQQDYNQVQQDFSQAKNTVVQLESKLEQNKLDSAKKLIALNVLSNEQIAKATELTIEQIKQLKV